MTALFFAQVMEVFGQLTVLKIGNGLAHNAASHFTELLDFFVDAGVPGNGLGVLL